jgi:signal transduction histidine kinase/ActR/RegA family two-component response regulator
MALGPLRRVTPVFLLLACLGALRAESMRRDPEAGRPPVQAWTMRDYLAFPQNWVARRDREGRMYFGNRDGVIVYDGRQWRTLPMPGIFIRGLDFGADGRLYAGGVDEFGYFQRDALGEWGPFVSLRDHLPEEERALSDIWSVNALPDGVFFVTYKRVFRWHDGAFKIWKLDGEWNVFGYRAGDAFYLHRRNDALRVIRGDSIEVAIDVPEVRANRLAGITLHPSGGLLLAWPRAGAARWDGRRLEPFAPAWQDWMRAKGITRVDTLPTGEIAVMTETGGLGVFSAAGELIHLVDERAGLPSAYVRSIQVDGEGGLWLALNHGVARSDPLAGHTHFDRANGLGSSSVREIVRHAGTLYVATGDGIYRLVPARGEEPARFEMLPGSSASHFGLKAHPRGLVSAAPDGIRVFPVESPPRRITVDRVAMFVLPLRNDPDAFWVGGRGRLELLRHAAGEWAVARTLPVPADAEIRSLVEGPDGALWAGTPTRGALRWRAPLEDAAAPPDVFFESAGLPAGHGWLRMVGWGDRVLVSAKGGVLEWSPEAGRFVPLPVAEGPLRAGAFNLHGGDPERLWAFSGPSRSAGTLLGWTRDQTYRRLPQQIVQAVGDVESMLYEEHGGRRILWAGGSYGLTRVDLDAIPRAAPRFVAVIGPVAAATPPRIHGGVPSWPHGKADLNAGFAATTFRSGTSLRFQSLLEGYEEQWTNWLPDHTRNFTNLPAGGYVLRLRARDADGRIGEEAALPFRVLPPWWQSPWSYLAAFLAAIGLLNLVVRWRVRLVERERHRLRGLVSERTRQLAESEQRLTHAKDAAEAANRSKSAFLASMSHELRTPLNSVLGYAQILTRSPEVGPNARRGLDAIRRSGDHLLQLINEILDLAKVEAGRIELVPEPFDLARLLLSVSETLAPKAAEKGLAFAVPDPDGLPEVVLGDEPRLRQVLLNLVGNAVKFTEAGAVSWTVARKDGDRIRFEVSDTGIGIPKEEQAQVFSPFYQTSGAAALTRQGTGLGLSISAQLVRLMGGRLEFESEPGKGSRFWFEVTLPPTSRRRPYGADALLGRGVIVGYHGRPRRILVVDDERSNREVLLEMLKPLDFVVEEAVDAPAARAAVARTAPDLVILDLRMPGESGYELARHWREARTLNGAKVLALSASVLPDQQADALRAGCDAFLAKPFRLEHLLHAIGSLLELSWVYAQAPAADDGPRPLAREPSWIVWEEPDLQRLLALAEAGDALRLGDELAAISRRGPDWATAVAPWQRLAVTYQMEALSHALHEALQRFTPSAPHASARPLA